MNLTVDEVVKACRGKFIKGNPQESILGISIDSRNIMPGELFIPLKGERFDGHDFITEACKRGAAGSLTSNLESVKGCEGSIILVEDTLSALQDIAHFYRKKFPIPFIAVTGSTGKTTTKDLISKVLSQRFNVLKTTGNLNNQIGLPLTLLKLNSQHQIGVVEMGMSGFGEIARLTKIVNPRIAVLTNIGLSHIEKLGSVENIAKAKSEIFEGLEQNGKAFLNADDIHLLEMRRKFPHIEFKTYGIKNGDIRAVNIVSSGQKGITFDIVSDERTEYGFILKIPGVHNVYNALAAVSVGFEFGLNPDEIQAALRDFKMSKMRLEITEEKDSNLIIINDAYNASPDSMKAALNLLQEISSQRGRRAVAVLGNMLEMGTWGPPAHREIGRFVAEKGIDYLITVGDVAEYIAAGAKEGGMPGDMVFSFKTNMEAIKKLEEIKKEYDIILVKGSRGMKMEEIVHYLSCGGNF